MNTHARAWMISAGLVAALGCGSTPPAKDDKKPADTKPAPASAPASTAAVPTPTEAPKAPEGPKCRVLVNAEGQLAGSAGYMVADVTFGASPAVQLGSGLVARLGAESYAIQKAHFVEVTKGGTGSFTGEWDEIVLTKLPGGAPVTITKNKPEVVLPEEDAGMPEFSTQQTVSFTGLVGPYLSFMGGGYGFTGGAHEFDDARYVTISLPGGEPASFSFLAEVQADLEAQLKKEDERRRGELGDDETLPRPTELRNIAFSMRGDEGKQGVRLLHRLECCSWAENHGYLELDVPLSKVPSALQAHVALSADAKWIESPDGCGAVAIEGGKLKVRPGKEGAAQEIALPGVSGAISLMGVYWLPADDPFAVSQLPTPIPETKTEK